MTLKDEQSQDHEENKNLNNIYDNSANDISKRLNEQTKSDDRKVSPLNNPQVKKNSEHEHCGFPCDHPPASDGDNDESEIFNKYMNNFRDNIKTINKEIRKPGAFAKFMAYFTPMAMIGLACFGSGMLLGYNWMWYSCNNYMLENFDTAALIGHNESVRPPPIDYAMKEGLIKDSVNKLKLYNYYNDSNKTLTQIINETGD